MSDWTYVSGVIEIYAVGRTQPQKRYTIDSVLEHLPYVTGSEGNMRTYVIQENGSTDYASHNEFGESMRYRPHEDGHSQLMAVQSLYMIVVEGKLRNRYFEETLRELSKWLSRLSKRLIVESITIQMNGVSADSYTNKKIIITDERPYSDMYEMEKPWIEYLLPEYLSYLEMPLLLKNKYHKSSDVEEELGRRNVWRESMSNDV